MKTTDFIVENQFIGDDAHAMHQDNEIQMARSDCYNAAKYAIELHKMLKEYSESQGLDSWISEKLTLANDYLRTVAEHIRHETAMSPAEPEMFAMESTNARYNSLVNEQVDMKGKKCTACKKGTYQETSQMDDMDGILHCTKCKKAVKRHQTAKPKEQGVAEEASPMIKPPANRFDNKQEAFAYAKEHGGKVFNSTYIDPNTGIKNITFVVKKESGVAEGKPQKKADRYHINKDGEPATLASYTDRASAVKDRDDKYPGAKVHQVGPRGKVKGEFEEGVAEAGPFSYGAKPPRKGTEKYNIAQANKKYYSNRPVTEPNDQMVGNAKITKNKEQDIAETTSAGAVATAPGVGKGPQTGSLFGGSYSPKTPFTAKKNAKGIIKR